MYDDADVGNFSTNQQQVEPANIEANPKANEQAKLEILVAASWIVSIMAKELEKKLMKEIERDEELRLRKIVLENISTSYSRRHKKAKMFEEPESQKVSTPEHVIPALEEIPQAHEKTPEVDKVVETPRAPITITFLRNKSIPEEKKAKLAKEVENVVNKEAETEVVKTPEVVEKLESVEIVDKKETSGDPTKFELFKKPEEKTYDHFKEFIDEEEERKALIKCVKENELDLNDIGNLRSVRYVVKKHKAYQAQLNKGVSPITVKPIVKVTE
ncbi:hypothetical protein L1987_87121 [Smallanthus sonchifolius]|nr:hypothetical protein L1987_87121 [Smallanthus sonchifolius]